MYCQSLLVVLLGLSLTLALGIQKPKIEIPTNAKIQKLQQQTQVQSAQNPNYLGCFGLYNPILNDVTHQYEAEYITCINYYDGNSTLLEDKWRVQRQSLENSGKGACGAIRNCATVVGIIEGYECYATVAAEESKTMYAISADASDYSVGIREDYRVIDTQQTICINNAERTYVEDTTKTYEQLNECLNGNGGPISTMVPTTSIPFETTPEYTTEYPYETTAAP